MNYTLKQKNIESNTVKRLFIAVPLPEEIRNELYHSLLLPQNYRKTSPVNLHITLLFLGDVPENQIPLIINALQAVSQKLKPFSLNINQSGQFPAHKPAKILYVTGDQGAEQLKQWAAHVRKELAKLGYIEHKPFFYHITVGRSKLNGIQNISLNIPALFFAVNRIVLYQSTLTRRGPVYQPLWEKNY